MSAKSQNYDNLEIIVVDDGSPTPLPLDLQTIPGIQIYRITNSGCPAARNFGYERSSGNYLLFLDGDDRLLPRAVESRIRALSEKPVAGLTFGAVRRINERGEVIRKCYLSKPRKDYFRLFLESCPIECPGGSMVRRDAFEFVGRFDPEFPIFGPAEDYDYF